MTRYKGTGKRYRLTWDRRRWEVVDDHEKRVYRVDGGTLRRERDPGTVRQVHEAFVRHRERGPVRRFLDDLLWYLRARWV